MLLQLDTNIKCIYLITRLLWKHLEIKYDMIVAVLFKSCWRACFWHGIYNFPQYLIYLLMDVSRKFFPLLLFSENSLLSLTTWSINRPVIVRCGGKTRINFNIMGKSLEYKRFINKLYISVCLSRFLKLNFGKKFFNKHDNLVCIVFLLHFVFIMTLKIDFISQIKFYFHFII